MTQLKGSTLARQISQWTYNGGVDLHLHSNCSDGSASPEATTRMAVESELEAFALTDHDSLAGLERVYSTLSIFPEEAQPVFVPGIEASLDFHGSCHTLAYFPDLETANNLIPFIDKVCLGRRERNLKVMVKLQELGFKLRLEDAEAFAQEPENTGRVHIAQAMLAKGYVDSLEEALHRYLLRGGAAYVDRERIPLVEGVDAVHKAGGVAFMAHPQEYPWSANEEGLRQGLLEAKATGLDGVECFHSEATPAEQQLIYLVTRELGLEFSAGSDWHGTNTKRPHYTGASKFVG
ncbi:MAG: PHP domain-containing protein [Eubacteriales bacterium]|nr:PHP domain-containing protein [Eubacteriales bacterium]